MVVERIFRGLSNTQFMKNHAERVISDDILAARLLVGSNVLKDAVVYGFRFDKSRKNKEIPEDKREFVAAMDLASGLTTCVVQLGLGFAIANRKFQTQVVEKLFKKVNNKEIRETAQKGFMAAAALIGSGVIGERIIVPLIATPFATHIKEKYIGEDGELNLPIQESIDNMRELTDFKNYEDIAQKTFLKLTQKSSQTNP